MAERIQNNWHWQCVVIEGQFGELTNFCATSSDKNFDPALSKCYVNASHEEPVRLGNSGAKDSQA